MKHKCNEWTCICPIDEKITHYHEPTNTHACVNPECENANGFELEEKWQRRLKPSSQN